MSRIGGHFAAFESPLDSEFRPMQTWGMPPGLYIRDAAARCGIGAGAVRITADKMASFRAPGSTTFGPEVDISSGSGAFLLDGDDPDKWITVAYTVSELPATASETTILFQDRDDTPAGTDREVDISAGTEVFTFHLRASVGAIENVTCWLPASERGSKYVQLSIEGGTAAAPTNEADGLAAFGDIDIAEDGEIEIEVQASGPDATPHPRRRLRIMFSWDDGLGGRAYSELRAVYGVYREEVRYMLYRGTGTNPDLNIDAPVAESDALPFSDVGVADGDHRYQVVYENRYGLASAPTAVERIEVASGSEVGTRPNGPDRLIVSQVATRVPRIVARYVVPGDADRLADEWAIWYSTDGSDPDSGDPDITVPLRLGYGGLATLDYTGIAQQADSTVVKVALRVRRAGVESSQVLTGQVTIDGTGPAEPASGNVYRG